MNNIKLWKAFAIVMMVWLGLTNVMAADAIDVKNATIKWAFDKGVDNSSKAVVSVPNGFSSTSFSLSNKLYFNGTQGTLSKLNPTDKIGNAREEASYVVFSIVPKKGVKFALKKLNFESQKCGTSGGTLDVVVKSGKNTVDLIKGANPDRNSASAYEEDLSSIASVTEKVDFIFYVP